MIARIMAGLALAVALLGATPSTVAIQSVGSESTHEVPEWMNRVCKYEDSVNCYWDGGTFKPDQGTMFVREMPGRKHRVCVFYVDHPRRDYCA
jgi:hypothetical protein